MDEVEALVRVLPSVSVSAEAFTENCAEIAQSDMITWRFKIKYDSMTAKEFPGLVHSEQYPFLKKQSWYILVTDETKDRTILFTKV